MTIAEPIIQQERGNTVVSKAMRNLAIAQLCLIVCWVFTLLFALVLWPFFIFFIPIAMAQLTCTVWLAILVISRSQSMGLPRQLPWGPPGWWQASDGHWYPPQSNV